MPDISKINALAIGSVGKVDGLAKASILDIDGVAVPSAVVAPAAAYSVRLLGSAVGVSSYTGPAMRIRRVTGVGNTGNDDEADVAFDTSLTEPTITLDSAVSNFSAGGSNATTLGQFLNVGTVGGTTYSDADSLAPNTAAAYVDEWKDQSGNANHATQGTPSRQPQIHSGTASTDLITENGKPAINFQVDVLATSGNITLSDGAYFCVAVGTTNGGANNIMVASDGTPRVGQFVRASSANTLQSIGFTSGGSAGTATGPSVGVDTQFLGIGECTGTILKAYVNGTSGSGISFTNRTDAAPLYVGARNSTAQDAHNGYIQEVIHYPDNQSSNRTGIETDINGFFSIY